MFEIESNNILFFSLHRFIQQLSFERVPFAFYMDVVMVERGRVLGIRHFKPYLCLSRYLDFHRGFPFVTVISKAVSTDIGSDRIGAYDMQF